MAWAIVNTSLCSYILAMVIIFWDQSAWERKPCVKKLDVWLIVYLCLQALHMIRTCFVMLAWWKAKDPSVIQLKIELFFGVWVFLMEAGWIIYGNSFIYTDEMVNCEMGSRYRVFTAQIERTTVLILVIYGYFLLAAIAGVLIFFVIFFFGYKSYI